MKKLALALAFLIGSIASAFAACTSPAVMHDFPGTSFNMSLATNAGDGNCASNIVIVGTLPAYAAIPAFKFDQTTPGTTNGVQVNAALPAGTNLLGKVGIDQTTPGTTNGVQVNAALPAGSNIIGKTGIDQTTPGVTNGAGAAQATVSAGNSLNGVTANTTGTSIPVTGFGAALFNVNCSVNCTGGTVINFQASDVVGFQAVGAMPVAGASTMATSVTNQSGAAFFCVPNFGYTNMRANVASYSAGTISVTITPINAASCDVAQIANALAAVANNADGVSASASLSNSPVLAYPMGWNGTTYDRQQVDSAKNLKVVTGGGTPISASATGTTAATTATLAGTSGKTTFICGLSIRANATAAATGNATVTGTITGTLNFTQWTAPNASGVGVTEEVFSPCLAASGTNQAIAVVSAAPGTGGVVSSTAWGYQQ